MNNAYQNTSYMNRETKKLGKTSVKKLKFSTTYFTVMYTKFLLSEACKTKLDLCYELKRKRRWNKYHMAHVSSNSSFWRLRSKGFANRLKDPKFSIFPSVFQDRFPCCVDGGFRTRGVRKTSVYLTSVSAGVIWFSRAPVISRLR